MNDAGWIGLATLAVTGLFAWLNKRDSLRHDTELRDLKQQNAGQAEEIAELKDSHRDCEEKHAETTTALKSCEQRHETVELRVEQIEKQIGMKK